MLDKILENQVQQHKQTDTPQANEAYSGNARLFSIFFFNRYNPSDKRRKTTWSY